MNARQCNRPRPVNKSSSLLTKEENELVFSVLGKKCVSLATAVVQVFMTEPPNHLHWVKQYCGAACLVKDNPRHSYFIRVVDIDKKAMIWDQELYDQFEYKVPMPFFHTFESDSCQAGLNFADENEANCFKIAVQTKLRQWQQRQEKKRFQQSLQPTSKGIPGQISGRRAESLPSLHNAEKKKKDKKKQKLSKADIGHPTDFIHIQHVGWDRKDLDFDISQSEQLDPQLRNFFKIAGVSEKDLADKSTRNFIYDFIDKNGGLNVIRGASKPSGQAPPVPARDASAAHHPSPAIPVRSAAPLPPSTRSAAPPPPIPPPPNRAPSSAPPPLPTSNKPSLLLNTSALHTPPQIPATAMRVPPPPPPPPAPCPPPPPAQIPPPPPPPPPPPSDNMPPVTDARAALLDGIRKGISLNPVVTNGDTPKSSSPSDGRDALLSQIRQGIELRPVSEEVKNTSFAPPLEGLAGALASALQERAHAMHQTDESDSDEDELDDDEWDD